jgi:hypothetical protein
MVQLVKRADLRASAPFVEAIPYRIFAVLIDNGIQFADRAKNRRGPTVRSASVH